MSSALYGAPYGAAYGVPYGAPYGALYETTYGASNADAYVDPGEVADADRDPACAGLVSLMLLAVASMAGSWGGEENYEALSPISYVNFGQTPL